MNLNRMNLLNTHINNLSLDEIILYLEECIQSGKLVHSVSLNVDQIMKIENNPEFRDIVSAAELVTTDGTPLMWIARLFGKPIKQKLPGPYFTEKILEYSALKGYKVYFLGGKEGVAAAAAGKMQKKYPGLNVVGTYSPPFGFEKDEKEINKIVDQLHASGADILVLGLGAPKQEKFVYQYRDCYQIPVSLSVGAAIDFMAGSMKRAPGWINKIGMEWLYRFTKEPARLFKRYFVDDMKILRLIFKYKS